MNLGELQLLNKMLQAALSVDENYVLKLFRADFTPDANTADSSLTEANFTNYVAKTLTRANWNNAVTVGGVAQTSYGSAPLSWTCGATGNTVYGYWVNGATSGQLLWAERFSVSRTLATNDVLNLTPQFSLQSAN